MSKQKQLPHYDAVYDMAEATPDPLEADEKRIEDEIAAEFGADGESEWIVTVKQVNPLTKKQDTCFKMSPGELPGLFDRLKNEYGPGEYRAYVTRNGELKRNLAYRIAKPLASAAMQSAPSQISDLGRLLERQTEMIANLVRGGTPSPAPAPDPMAMFSSMMTALAGAKEMFSQPPAPQTNIKEFIEIITLAKDLTGDNGGGGKGVIDLLSELVRSPIAEEIAGQLKQERQTTQQLIARPVPPKPSPQIAPTQNTAPVPELFQFLDQATIAQLKSQTDFLVTRAAANSDPNLYAEILCDILPIEMIGAFFQRDDLMQSLVYLNPVVGQYPQWFEEMREAVNHILTAEADAEDNDADAMPPEINVPKREAGNSAALNTNGDTLRRGGGESDARNNAPVDARGKNKPGGARKGKGAH